MARIRTSLKLDHDYVQRIMRRYQLRTKTEAVDLALHRTATEPMTLAEAREMEGSNSIGEMPADRPPVNAPA